MQADDPSRHAIHLGAAWQPPSPTAEAGGPAAWTRRFGRPSGIAAGDRVFLTLLSPEVSAEISVNGTPLVPLFAAGGVWSQEITSLLGDRNELVIVTAAAAGDESERGGDGRCPLPARIGRVTIEIVPAGMRSAAVADRPVRA